jgi:hypothetical protein
VTRERVNAWARDLCAALPPAAVKHDGSLYRGAAEIITAAAVALLDEALATVQQQIDNDCQSAYCASKRIAALRRELKA